MYAREFLLSFQHICTERPDGLPPMEVILGFDEKGSRGLPPKSPAGANPPQPFANDRNNNRRGPLNNSGDNFRRNSRDNIKGNNNNNLKNKPKPGVPILPAPAPLVHNPGAWAPRSERQKDSDPILVILRNATGYEFLILPFLHQG